MRYKPTPSEKIKSIEDARKPVAEFLTSIGKLDAFNTFTKDDICGLIRAAHDGVQQSLKDQAAAAFGEVPDDEIPW